MPYYVLASNRSLVSVKGADGKAFLQGLITNDMNIVSSERSIYTALLTPQGKFLYDFFVFEFPDGYGLDVAADRVEDLVRHLNKYKLRSQVVIEKYAEDLPVYFIYGQDEVGEPGFTRREGDATLMVDPRLSQLGMRYYGKAPNGTKVPQEEYEACRMALGVPEAGKDLRVEKSIPLECGLEELNAIAWDKGCYMGQELTARTKYRGLVRKRLLPITFEGDPLPQDTILTVEDAEVGKVMSSIAGRGIAIIRLEALGNNKFWAGETEVQAHIMPWMKITYDNV